MPTVWVFCCVRGAPRLAPLRRRSSTGRVGSSPRPPYPPPIYLSLSYLLCVYPSFVCVSIVCVRFVRGVRVGGVLGSLRSLRFKRPLVRAPLHPRVTTAVCTCMEKCRENPRFLCSRFPYALLPTTLLPKKRPHFSHWALAYGARSSSKSPKRWGQSGKGARCAPLGVFIGYGVTMIVNGYRCVVCRYVLRS